VHGEPWRPSLTLALIGGLLLVAGSALNLWASGRFTKYQVRICPFSLVPRLIEDGPYRFTRNPMYLGMVFLVSGVSLLMACPWNLWTALAYAIWLHIRFILPEERFLGGLFGEAYTAYAKKRGRWLGWS
jgi:protein-S-isoprenylcysteine O-methyltransferase Ste14